MLSRVFPRRENNICKSTEAWANKFGRLVHRVGSRDLSNTQPFHGKDRVSTVRSGETDVIIMPDTALMEVTM